MTEDITAIADEVEMRLAKGWAQREHQLRALIGFARKLETLIHGGNKPGDPYKLTPNVGQAGMPYQPTPVIP